METITAGDIREAILQRDPNETVQCFMTGGGVATIYLGEPDADGRYRIAIGPGTFDWADEWLSVFGLGDTAVGPDDDGEGEASYPTTLDGIVARATLPYLD
jgi:hypothetical protein